MVEYGRVWWSMVEYASMYRHFVCALHLGIRSWCSVQHSHGLSHSLQRWIMCKTGQQALKLGVTEHQAKETVCIQVELLDGVLQERR